MSSKTTFLTVKTINSLNAGQVSDILLWIALSNPNVFAKAYEEIVDKKLSLTGLTFIVNNPGSGTESKVFVPEGLLEILKTFDSDRKVTAIKEVRHTTNCGLFEAKVIVEYLGNHGYTANFGGHQLDADCRIVHEN